ncbi:MAG: oligoendopeptidase F [Candidatus Nanohaloarchaea archaeon]
MTVAERSEIDPEYKWDVESVYPGKVEWEEDFEEVRDRLEELEDYRGELDDGEKMLDFLDLLEELKRKAELVHRYATMKRDEDSRDQEAQAMASRASSLRSRLESATGFMNPEIAEMGEEKLEEMMDVTPGLEDYRHFLEEIVRKKPHTRSVEVETVIAEMGEVLDSPSRVFRMLSNADLDFPEVDGPERSVEITNANFTSLLKERDREFREKVHEAYYSTIDGLRNTIGAAFEDNIRKNVRLAETRDYGSAREASLDRNRIPVGVYDSLVDTVRENLDRLHRHVDLKKRNLEVDSLKPWDFYMPMTDSEGPEIPFEKAKEHVVEAVAPLGDEYQSKMKKGLNSGWVDVYENRGKRSGAYSGGAYDTKPFILMNYQDDVSSMYTLAHELGHSMHSLYTKKNQDYFYSDYPIFLAEIASTTNEALLTQHLLETVEDEEFRRHVLSHYLENFRNTIYRQTMFAEFEQQVHRRVREGEALTPDRLDENYRELKSDFYEPADLDGMISKEWMRIPHFYYNFYVYQYATGMSAAETFARRILEGEGRRDYMEFLKAGSSDYPLEVLRDAGIEMNSPEPVEKALDVYKGHLDRMEKMV